MVNLKLTIASKKCIITSTRILKGADKMKNIDIPYFAKLAHISVSAEELPNFQQDIETTLESFADLPDFSDVKFEIDATNSIRLREDEVSQTLTQGEILANAPKQSGGCIVIPKTVE
jgi:aspartyl/glutamyl-tRNA(Asn/Gln) amidotransferase C subunit